MRGEEMDFHDVDRRYAELKRQYDSGTLAAEGCDSQLQQLMLQGGEGRWWAKDRESGEWYYHDGSAWILQVLHLATSQLRRAISTQSIP